MTSITTPFPNTNKLFFSVKLIPDDSAYIPFIFCKENVNIMLNKLLKGDNMSVLLDLRNNSMAAKYRICKIGTNTISGSSGTVNANTLTNIYPSVSIADDSNIQIDVVDTNYTEWQQVNIFGSSLALGSLYLIGSTELKGYSSNKKFIGI
jgi:hypothetical protein